MAPLASAFVNVTPNMTGFAAQAAAGIASARLGAAGAAQGAAFGTSFGKAASKLMVVGFGAGLGLLLKASVEAAGDFEAQMIRLVTSAGETGTLVSGNLKVVAEGIKAMAGPVGTSIEALGKAMYTVESGSFHGAAGLKVLQAAAEGAKAEGADLTKVTNAVTTALVDYHLDADQAAFVTTKLVAATAAGKTTFEQLTGALHSVLPIAAAAGISLEDILGSLASMTLHGVSAEQATQNLADVIRHMQNPTSVQAKELALLGLTTNQLATDLKTKGLSGTLGEISDRIRKLMPPGSDQVILQLRTALNSLSPQVRALGMRLIEGSISYIEYRKAARDLTPIQASQAMSFATLAGATHRIGDVQLTGTQTMQSYGAALARATGDATGLNVALMLTGDNAGQTNTAIAAVTAATTEAGNHVKGWGEIQQTFNYKLASFHASLGVLKVALGESLLPLLGRMTESVTAAIAPMTAWINEHQRATAIIAGSTAGLVAFTTAVLITAKLVGAIQALAAALRLAAIAQGLWTAAVATFNVVTSWTLIQVVALIAWTKIAAVATKVWAAGQWLLNAALSANPIGLIVIAIAALVAGFIYAYTHSKTFRAIVDGALRAVGAAGIWMWDHALKPVFEALVAVWHVVATVAMWLWTNIIKPVAAGIALEMRVMATVVMWLWHSVSEPFGAAMGRIFTAIWIVIQIAVKIIWTQLQVWGQAAMWLWHTIIEPFARGIAAAVMWLWNNGIKPWADGIVAKFHLVAEGALWLWHHVIEPWADGIAAKVTLWWTVLRLIFDAVKGWITDTLPRAFRTGVEGITNAWDKVREAARVPVAFVVNQVINPAIRGFNKIADFFGVKTRVEEIKGYAEGGLIHGPGSGTSDSILAQVVGGPRIRVSNGEYIIPADKVQEKGVDFWDSMAGKRPRRSGDLGYADGGIIDFGKNLFNLFTDPKKLILGPINSLLGKVPGGGTIRDIVIGAARRVADQMVSWITGGAGFGPGGGGNAGTGVFTPYPSGWPPRIRHVLSPNTAAAQRFVQATWHIPSNPDVGRNDPFDHPWGKALDNMTSAFSPTGRAVGNSLAGWFVANPRVFGTKYVIWNKQITTGTGWRPYIGDSTHEDHVHVSLFNRGGLVRRFDRGGAWPSGTVGVNTSGRTEHVTTGSGMDRIEKLLERQNTLIERLTDAVEYVAPGVGRELRGTTRSMLQAARAR